MANGDLAKTAGGAANQSRELWGWIGNLATTLGEPLLPVASSALGQLNTGLVVLSNVWTTMGNSAISSATASIGGLAQTASAAGLLQKPVAFVADAWQTMKLGFLAAQSYITSGIEVIIRGLVKIERQLNRIDSWVGKSNAAGSFFATWQNDLKNTVSGPMGRLHEGAG